AAMEQILQAHLPPGYDYAWSGISWQEQQTGNQAVWIVLAAVANWLHGGVRDPAWVIDHIDQDVPMLIEQIRTRVLPKRGIVAA
ncbi:efflux RND transporter permease subunit, partial [Klebsiella pneumoniae]|uniref:efflux RND transporter permease subunit n=1 Tax=Klebsiella pneumoniae TaxID=573 RepID=UPI001E5E9268